MIRRWRIWAHRQGLHAAHVRSLRIPGWWCRKCGLIVTGRSV